MVLTALVVSMVTQARSPRAGEERTTQMARKPGSWMGLASHRPAPGGKGLGVCHLPPPASGRSPGLGPRGLEGAQGATAASRGVVVSDRSTC